MKNIDMYMYKKLYKCITCDSYFYPNDNTFRCLMNPWVGIVNSRHKIQTNHCCQCIDNIVENSDIHMIRNREIGIVKKRKINVKFNNNTLETKLVYQIYGS